MTDLTFLSHVSRGLGALATDDAQGATVSLTITAQPSGETRTVSRAISLARPCDVGAIDPGAIFRTDPDFRGEVRDFEPNYLPLVEFAAIDFPWRFSAAAPGAGRRIPWLTLIVLATGEYTFRPGGRASDGSVRLPSVRVDDPAGVLPRSDQLGAWCHGQAVGDLAEAPTSALNDVDRSASAATRSRLLAARRLRPRTEYLAALVPTTECGRRRGLDPDGPHEHSAAPAWSGATTGSLDLPVYFHWRFATSAAGDIESLARALVPRRTGPDAGTRPLVVGLQPFGVPALADPLTQRGALIAPEAPSVPDEPAEIAAPLIAALNAPDDLNTGAELPLEDVSAVAPPLYGQWHADRARVDEEDAERPWFASLNTRLANRAAAGLGAEVIRRHQEALVAEAWRQVGDLSEARRKIDIAGFGVLTAGRLHETVFGALSDDAVVLMARPALSRLGLSEGASLEASLSATSLAGIADSALARASMAPRGALKAALRRPAVALDTATAVTTLAASTAVAPTFSATIADPLLSLALDPDDVADPAAALAPIQPVEATALSDRIRAALHPGVTIPGRIDGLIDGLDIVADDGIAAPDLPGPEIDRPMYAPLRDIAVSHLVPGIGDMAPSSVSLLAPNRDFIEAYMAGLNHEFGRELIWRGFPAAGLSVTYFRHFWESAGDHPDIAPMSGWRGLLGANGGTGTELVLAIRSDLILRYPGLMIYAQRASFEDTGYMLTETVSEPIFRADLAPDILALGFGIDAASARGFVPDAGAQVADHVAELSADPGWFFVFEEQPREARFGLDMPGTGGGSPGSDWNNVSWAHAAPATAPDPAIWDGPIDLAAPTARALPVNPPWNGSAAEMAEALFQHPFRIGIHAQRLLPDLEKEEEV